MSNLPFFFAVHLCRGKLFHFILFSFLFQCEAAGKDLMCNKIESIGEEEEEEKSEKEQQQQQQKQ